jgi:hypothetical protein
VGQKSLGDVNLKGVSLEAGPRCELPEILYHHK